MNFSRQREIIYEQVRNFPVHPTAEEVYRALKNDNPNLSLGTVYRNLNQLSEAGMLLKIPIADGSDRFDGRADRHYHMICEKCGRALKDAESILRGYGPVCYKKIMPPRPKKTRAAKGDCSPVDDWDYEVPGQMELSDFIEMPKGGNDDD